MSVKINTRSLERFGSKARRFTSEFQARQSILMEEMAALAEATAQELAPRDTGHYATTIRAEVRGSGFVQRVRLQSDAPQARRLEHGFFGVDSLGRLYNQPAQPHMRPAMQIAWTQIRPALRSLPKQVWRSL